MRLALGPVALVAAMTAGRSLPARAMDGDYESAAARIDVRLVERLTSADAKAGSLFHFDTTSSVLIAGRFLPAQTHGHGVILAVRSGRPGRPGMLLLAARSLDPSDGEPVEVGLEPGRLVPSVRAPDVVYDRGTAFFVDAPPPPSPVPT